MWILDYAKDYAGLYTACGIITALIFAVAYWQNVSLWDECDFLASIGLLTMFIVMVIVAGLAWPLVAVISWIYIFAKIVVENVRYRTKRKG